MADSVLLYIGAPVALAVVAIIGVWVRSRR